MSNTIIRRLRRWLLTMSVIAVAIFMISGQWQDGWLWAYVGVVALVGLYPLLSLDDELARERFRPPEAGADRAALRVIRVTALAHIVVGALDAGRLHLTTVPPSLRLVGLAGMAIFALLTFYAMLSNRFFSPVVRIQKERGHRVIDRGPYSIVRHPGYAGMIPVMAFSGLAFGSWIAFGIGLIYAALMLRRVMFEDAFLRLNLEGYSEYATRVRYRLVPRVW